MGNDRLRSAIARAGLEIEDLAAKADVDAKTVGRWLGGRVPRPRYRTKVAIILNLPEQELWPEITPTVRDRDDRREIAGAFAHANDIHVPDWRSLLYNAREEIELLGYTLIEFLASPGTTDVLRAKATAGCEIRILIAHPQTIWITSTAEELGENEPDHEGSTPLDLELDLARGHLETLASHPKIELRAHWAQRYNTILRFDDQMLVTLHLHATERHRSPILHLQRRDPDGLFEQFASHLDTIHQDASQAIDPNPDLYPNPNRDPARYEPVTRHIYEQRRREAQRRSGEQIAASPPSDQTRERIRTEQQKRPPAP